MARIKEKYYIAHLCLNSKLPNTNKDYCYNGFIDIAPQSTTCAVQCWKYCKSCEEKGYPIINEKFVSEEEKLKIQRTKIKKD